MLNRRQFFGTTSRMAMASALMVGGLTRLRGHDPSDHPHDDHGDGPLTDGDQAAVILGHDDHRYRLHADWGKLDPQQYPIINCHAMVQAQSGLLYALTDVKANNLIVYQPDGTFVEAMDLEYAGAHGLAIAANDDGQEYLFIADSGWANRSGRQVNNETGRIAKVDLRGQLQFTIGHPQTVGAYQPGQRFKPCDLAIAPNGDIYVADGYGSNCVLRYDQHGRYISHWGGADDPHEERRLKNAHGVSVDLRNPDQPMLLVPSRSQNIIKKFTFDGDYLGEISLPGAFAGQMMIHGDYAYTGVCWSRNPKGKRVKNSGFVAILDKDDRVVSCPGGTEPTYAKGQLQRLTQDEDSPFLHVHDLCLDADGNIYVCQWNSQGAYPYKLERIR